MQAIILAAGYGGRLGQLTNGQTKGLLSLGGKPIIHRHIEMFRRHGVKDIVVVLGHNPDSVRQSLKAFNNIHFAFNPFYQQSNVLASMWFGKHLLKSEYLYVHGDTVFEEGVLKKVLKGTGDMVLAVDFKSCAEEEMKIKIKNHSIVKLSKNLPSEESDGEFIGLLKVNQSVLDDLHGAVDYFMEHQEFTHFFEAAIQRVIDTSKRKYKIGYVDISSFFWEEIDFMEDLARARQFFEK